MRIQIIAIGDRMPGWVQQAFNEYIKRIGAGLTVELVEISPEKRGKASNLDRIMEKEAARMRQTIPRGNFVIALDKEGKLWSTEQLAENVAAWQQDGRNISILIGGPEGMHSDLLREADVCVSLSAMTFPHPVVRIILAEQLYRTYSILSHHPYHK
ncbi:MAG: 23S rRNA (pseudouridine(1915)-N(3))-methyltransferase RlmH [Thioalkalispiraceae bacterium]|jgi:23S rRNA (pseudouridine1915-N3)-methyltransferase